MSVICGNTKRKTAVVEKMSDFACPEVFHFLIKGAKSSIVEVLLKEKESIGNDKCLGTFKVRRAYSVAGGRHTYTRQVDRCLCERFGGTRLHLRRD